MIQLNLGSGKATPLAGWLTMDLHEPGVSVIGNLKNLPFKTDSATHIHLSHVIEHVDIDKVPQVLAEIKRVLAPSGIFYCSAPDMDRAKAIDSKEWMYFTIKGSWTTGWEHKWTCNVKKLRKFLVDAGFIPTWAKALPPGWPVNTHSWPNDLEARFLCRHSEYYWPYSYPTNFSVQT